MNSHVVTNQSPILENVNLFELDKPLQNILNLYDANWGTKSIRDLGGVLGSAEWIKKGRQANQNPPTFHSHNSKGDRIDEIEFHPAYHDIMELKISQELHSQPWRTTQANVQIVHMAKIYLSTQDEAGTGCPISMTFSSVPSIQKNLPQAQEWLPKILNTQYDPSNKPYFEKAGLTIGMAMTEKQGGTDVRANTTEAKPIGKPGRGELYSLMGHKWFCSAPMCDAFLTLAQTSKGLSCFLFPRWKNDGSKNNFRILQLKDKLGNRSNASSEIEFDGAHAWLMGEEGRGVATIIEMVALTRYECMIGSASLMRRALTEVIHHIRHRHVFGKALSEHVLMQQVVADLALESYGALAMTARTAHSIENNHSEEEQQLLRLLTPIGKYYITKRASPMIMESLECLGGNGYIEDSILSRLYREAPVNAIWEGSGNVQCLDVLKAIKKSSQIFDNLISYLESGKGHNDLFDHSLEKLKNSSKELLSNESQARHLTERIAVLIQANELCRLGDNIITESFCQSRFSRSTSMYGSSPIANAKDVINGSMKF